VGLIVPSRVSRQWLPLRGASLSSFGSWRAQFPALSGTTKALRLPVRASAVAYWFAPAAHPILPLRVRRSAPGRLEDPSRPGLWVGRPPDFPAIPRVDANRISQVSRRSFPRLCCAPRPRSNRCVLAISATPMLPPLCTQRRLRRLLFRGSLTQLRHPLTYASRFVLPLTRKARFRLAGWPLPGGRRTLWTATKGFSSC
jgi:hypothetical protein